MDASLLPVLDLPQRLIKCFVLLGSAVSILDSFEDLKAPEGKPLTEDHWNTVRSLSLALHSIIVTDIKSRRLKGMRYCLSPLLRYNVGKKVAELAAWSFVNENNPAFEKVVINPDVIIGPLLQPVLSAKSINETNQFACYDFINGIHEAIINVTFPFWDFFDVRDIALMHIIALTSPSMAQKRNIVSSGPLSPQLVMNAIRKNFPQLDGRLPKGGDENEVYPNGLHSAPLNHARSLVMFREAKGSNWNYRTLDETIKGTADSLLELEQKWSARVLTCYLVTRPTLP